MSSTSRAITVAQPRPAAEIEQRIRLVTPGNRIMVVGTALVIGASLFWGIFGSIPTRVTGQGVVVTSAEDINAVGTIAAGVVRAVLVKVGDQIKAGVPVVRLHQPELESQVEHAKDRLEALQAHLAEIRREVAAEQGVQERQTLATLKSLELATRQAQDRSGRLNSILAAQESLLAQGYARRLDVEQLRQSRDLADADVLRLQAQQKQVDGSYLEFGNKLNARSVAVEYEVNDQRARYEELREKLGIWQVVRSPSGGHVEEIRVTVGSAVQPGEVLLTLAKENSDHQVLAFLDPYKGKLVKPGMRVHVIPSTVKKEEFGSMRGVVTEVSERALSEAAVNAMVQDDTLARSFVKNGAPLFARIDVDDDPKSPSGFVWWAGKGPDFRIETGTFSSVEVTVRTQPPITAVIPFLNKMFGL